MEAYNVIIDEPAEQDLRGILLYISKTLHEPTTAERIYFSIRAAISGLDHQPLRFQLASDETYAAFGVRKLMVENYIAFYVVDEPAREVHVWRILYNRREWQTLL